MKNQINPQRLELFTYAELKAILTGLHHCRGLIGLDNSRHLIPEINTELASRSMTRKR